MPGVAVQAVTSAGGPHLAGGQAFFTAGGHAIVVKGDQVTPHGGGPHAAPTMIGASTFFTVAGKGVCRAGDKASCDHASTGLDWFEVA